MAVFVNCDASKRKEYIILQIVSVCIMIGMTGVQWLAYAAGVQFGPCMSDAGRWCAGYSEG